MTEQVDPGAVRLARADVDPRALLAALEGRDPTGSLQRVGAALIRVARAADASSVLAPAMRDVAERLRARSEYGDDVLAEDLIRVADGRAPHGLLLPIDLEELAEHAASHGDEPGAYLNRRTGEVVPAFLTSDGTVDDQDLVDVEEGDWTHVLLESRDGHEDMADFAASVTDAPVRERLEEALRGRGPFRRFRDAVVSADLGRAWQDFEEERRHGHVRRMLARDEGIRPV